jgi:hypothetical protein
MFVHEITWDLPKVWRLMGLYKVAYIFILATMLSTRSS